VKYEGYEFVTGDGALALVGEDDHGDLRVYRRGRWVPFAAWRPSHWPAWIRSRRQRQIAFLDRG
jgi:hypothetical protein